MKSKVKKLIKASSGRLFKSAVNTIRPFKNKFIILMYHRVLDKKENELYDPAMYVEPGVLDMHINELIKHFDIVCLDEIYSDNRSDKPRCVITFDDGWRDNYDNAFEILKKYNVTATIFLTTNMIGKGYNFWFHGIWDLFSQAISVGRLDDLAKYMNYAFEYKFNSDIIEDDICGFINHIKKYQVDDIENVISEACSKIGINKSIKSELLDWTQVQEMSEYGIRFGAHTKNHCILPAVSDEIKKIEINESLEAIQDQGVRMSSYFCYPNGDCDEETVNLIKEAGCSGAVTTQLGYNDYSTNQYLLRRVAIHNDITYTPSLFWFRLLQTLV